MLRFFKSKDRNYIDIANRNKEKIIKKDVKSFKKYCIEEFESNIKKGITITTVDFAFRVSSEFQEEISELVLAELQEEYKEISFSFVYRHYQNSYKALHMVAKEFKEMG